MTYTKILGTGSYLPEKILTNDDLAKIVDTTHNWIVERTGIKQRHVAAEHETATSMAEQAAHSAISMAHLTPADLGMIIVATTTPELVFPSVACLLQQRLGIAGCPAFDLNATACAGFMYALSIADQYIRTNHIKHILVVGSEVMTRVIDWTDRTTCVLFGDGAGAVVLGPSQEPGILSTHIHADGHYRDILYLPLTIQKNDRMESIKMQGHTLFKLAINILGHLFDQTLEASGLPKSAIDWLIPHQANMRIIQGMAKKLELPLERVTITLDEQGNTSSASIPLALDQAVRDGRIQHGQLLLMEGFGGGLAWGSALIRY